MAEERLRTSRVKRRIDRQRLSRALATLRRSALLTLLERALDHLPDHSLRVALEGFLEPNDFVGGQPRSRSLIDEVRAFDEASRRGDYYESFNVNSKNYRQLSPATEEWLSECRRLLQEVVRLSNDDALAEVREAFELLFALLRRLDAGHDDIVFFADEGGSWQVGVDWRLVLPAYFRCLAATANAEEYARVGNALAKDLTGRGMKHYLSRAPAATKTATPRRVTARAKAKSGSAGRKRANRGA